MIIQETFYAVQCDNCKTIAEGFDDIAYWSDMSISIENAEDGDWFVEEDKAYCPDCYSFNDNDELIINENRKRNSDRGN
jgi:hypothetical protein